MDTKVAEKGFRFVIGTHPMEHEVYLNGEKYPNVVALSVETHAGESHQLMDVRCLVTNPIRVQGRFHVTDADDIPTYLAEYWVSQWHEIDMWFDGMHSRLVLDGVSKPFVSAALRLSEGDEYATKLALTFYQGGKASRGTYIVEGIVLPKEGTTNGKQE